MDRSEVADRNERQYVQRRTRSWSINSIGEKIKIISATDNKQAVIWEADSILGGCTSFLTILFLEAAIEYGHQSKNCKFIERKLNHIHAMRMRVGRGDPRAVARTHRSYPQFLEILKERSKGTKFYQSREPLSRAEPR